MLEENESNKSRDWKKFKDCIFPKVFSIGYAIENKKKVSITSFKKFEISKLG
jgi:hypothetical protein